MALHIRSHRAPCSCFSMKVPLQLSSEQSVGDVGITQLDWKRVPHARSSGCESRVAITAECRPCTATTSITRNPNLNYGQMSAIAVFGRQVPGGRYSGSGCTVTCFVDDPSRCCNGPSVVQHMQMPACIERRTHDRT